MRREVVQCDMCGAFKPERPAMPDTWWVLEQAGKVLTTAPRDFCSLPHLVAWLADADVQQAFPLDFAPTEKGAPF